MYEHVPLSSEQPTTHMMWGWCRPARTAISCLRISWCFVGLFLAYFSPSHFALFTLPYLPSPRRSRECSRCCGFNNRTGGHALNWLISTSCSLSWYVFLYQTGQAWNSDWNSKFISNCVARHCIVICFPVQRSLWQAWSPLKSLRRTLRCSSSCSAAINRLSSSVSHSFLSQSSARSCQAVSTWPIEEDAM